MILIKSTLTHVHLSVCKVVFIPKIAVPIRFLDSLKKVCAFILCVSDSGFQCNKHNSYWYGVQYQDRQTALQLGKYHFHWSHTTTFGQSVYPDIALHIKVLFLCFNLCLGVMLASLSCSFNLCLGVMLASLSCSFNLCLSVMLASLSCSFTYHFLLPI
jgi:hypothetical protein